MSHTESVPGPTEKVVLHVGYPLWRKHTLVAVARAKELQDSGHHVVLTYCNARRGTCAVNFAGSPAACAICQSRVRRTAEANGLTAVPLDSRGQGEELTLSEKQDMAEGVHSAVISTFRQLPNDGAENAVIRMIKRRYFQTACGLLRSMKKLLDQESPDRLEVFNGRHACSKFCITASTGRGMPFNTMEVTGKAKPILFEGHTAHDRFRIQDRMRELPVNMETARRYFQSRRQPSANRFTKKYSATFVPPNADTFKKKISVFLSSQDEFEALGREWRSPFRNYADVIQEACLKNPDYLFCIRFHPNQADMISDVITPFDDVGQLPNVIIYEPTDSANSYTLMEWSDIVVTFGSTVTIEACWMGKPTIMLGPSFYDQLDVSLNPSTMDEFLMALRDDLLPRPAENAAALPMYLEHDCNRDPLRYVGHNGKRMVSAGITLKRKWLSRIASSADNAFCRILKCYSGWYVKRQARIRQVKTRTGTSRNEQSESLNDQKPRTAVSETCITNQTGDAA
ncbi:MAG: hypothetical protein MK102_00750 [Fuerstiella sp.]|nr:hypothetical protein [Fuerstiella sp.]